VPSELAEEVEKCKTDKEVKEAGIDWCISQSNELKKSGVPCLHYYTMGTSDAVRRVAGKVF
jgi:methylenetetrahydrofolate reductase (NADPH)